VHVSSQLTVQQQLASENTSSSVETALDNQIYLRSVCWYRHSEMNSIFRGILEEQKLSCW